MTDHSPSAVDPRPRTARHDGGTAVVTGVRCVACGYTATSRLPRCPLCHSGVEDATFGPAGVVWSSTVVRIPVPGREPPYGLAYVDLTDGPRVLAHVRDGGSTPLPIGSPVRVVGHTEAGDLLVEVAS